MSQYLVKTTELETIWGHGYAITLSLKTYLIYGCWRICDQKVTCIKKQNKLCNMALEDPKIFGSVLFETVVQMLYSIIARNKLVSSGE